MSETVTRQTRRRLRKNEMRIKLDLIVDQTPGHDEEIKEALRHLFESLNTRGIKPSQQGN